MKYAVMALIVTCWTSVAFLYRVATVRNVPRMWIATGASGALLVLSLAASFFRGSVIPDAPGVLFSVGVVAGAAAVASVPLFAATVARGSLAVSWTILTLSFAAASLASLLYPGAAVNAAGAGGLALAAAAIILLGRDSGARGRAGGFRRGWGVFITLSFIANAFYMYAYTLADTWGGLVPVAHKMAMLVSHSAAFFLGSAVLCAFVAAPRGKSAAVSIGVGMGCAFFIGNIATMYALGDLGIEPYIFFPGTTGGSTITVALISVTALGERPSRFGWAGLALGLAAMVILGAAA